MALADDIIGLIRPAHDVIHADEWTVLTGADTGLRFSGVAEIETPLSLDGDLTTDVRAASVLWVGREAPALQPGYLLSGRGATWRVVGSMDDNPLNDRIKYEISKVSAKDSG